MEPKTGAWLQEEGITSGLKRVWILKFHRASSNPSFLYSTTCELVKQDAYILLSFGFCICKMVIVTWYQVAVVDEWVRYDKVLSTVLGTSPQMKALILKCVFCWVPLSQTLSLISACREFTGEVMHRQPSQGKKQVRGRKEGSQNWVCSWKKLMMCAIKTLSHQGRLKDGVELDFLKMDEEAGVYTYPQLPSSVWWMLFPRAFVP